SLIGASRILGADEFDKLQHLPLETFDDVQPSTAPVYVLSGAETGSVDPPLVALAELGGSVPLLRAMRSVQSVPGMYEQRIDAAPGMHILRFRLGGQAACATVIYTLPNRATLFVLASSASGETRVYQFILPLAKLKPHLSPMERNLLSP